MYARAMTSAFVALSSISAVLAGTASVQNNCGFDVYLWSVADSYDVPMTTLSSGSPYSETYRTNPNGGGISIKLSHSSSQSDITQFEYTLGGDLVFYDISNVNGAPFQDDGMVLVPSISSCPTVTCPAGVVCTEAYINPNDDYATKGCNIDTDLALTLCPGGSSSENTTSSDVAVSSSSSEPSPTTTTTTAVETSSATPTPTTTTQAATTLATSASSSSEEAAPTENLKYRPVAQKERSHHRARHVHGHPHARR